MKGLHNKRDNVALLKTYTIYLLFFNDSFRPKIEILQATVLPEYLYDTLISIHKLPYFIVVWEVQGKAQ